MTLSAKAVPWTAVIGDRTQRPSCRAVAMRAPSVEVEGWIHERPGRIRQRREITSGVDISVYMGGIGWPVAHHARRASDAARTTTR